MEKLIPIEYGNQRILTTQQLAENYETETRRISENFNDNKTRYAEGKHYYLLQGADLKGFKSEYGNSVVAENINKFYLWTEKGALLHAKSLNTDKAWEVYDYLVETYFKVKNMQANLNDLSPELQAIFMHDKKIQQVVTRVDKLENTMTIDYGQQLALQNIANKTVINFLGGKDSPAYKKMGKKVFKTIWHTYKEYFNVSSYKDTPVTRLDEAKKYLAQWMPGYNILLEIKDSNSAMVV